MSGRFSRGWEITKQCWHVVTQNPSLAVFPVLSVTFAMVAALVILTPATLGLGFGFAWETSDFEIKAISWVYVAVLLLVGYVCTVISVFFNVALAAAASAVLRGEALVVREAIGVARRRLGPILVWSLLSTGVGSLLSSVSKATGGAGSLLGWIGDAAWAVATFFVIPVIALEDVDAKHAVKRSTTMVKERWGEAASGAGVIGVVGFVLVMAVSMVGVIGFVAFAGFDMMWAAIPFAGIFALALIVMIFLSLALTAVFKVALYRYAADGAVPNGFDPEVLQGTFAEGDREG